MLRLILRGAGLLIAMALLAPAGFSETATEKIAKNLKKTDDTATVTPSDTTDSSDITKPDEAPASEAIYPATLAPSSQSSTGDKKDADENYKPAPKFTPMLATTGTIGLFTVETAGTLPKGAFAFSVFGNKFGRMPGSVSILQFGAELSYGITDRLNFYAGFDPYQRAHIGCPGQLSLQSIPLSTSCAPSTFGTPIPGSFFPTVDGSAPGYVQDYPFAANNTGGIGNVTLGLKYAFLSERHGAPVSFSIRNDLIISTKTDLNQLLANGTQSSPLSDLVSVALSKQWGQAITWTFNFGYMFVRAPRDSQSQPLFAMPDQVRTGVGFLMFPESRFQPMVEYSGVIFVSAPSTPPDNSFGARDPVEGVWGFRVYPSKHLAFDVGYRYMLNLRDLNDRNGFVIKIGTAFWPEKAPPANRGPAISCSADKTMVNTNPGDAVVIHCSASDPDNAPLTYTWSSTGGKVDGDGPQVRWLSAGAPAGSYTITAKVDNGRGGFASSSVAVSVESK